MKIKDEILVTIVGEVMFKKFTMPESKSAILRLTVQAYDKTFDVVQYGDDNTLNALCNKGDTVWLTCDYLQREWRITNFAVLAQKPATLQINDALAIARRVFPDMPDADLTDMLWKQTDYTAWLLETPPDAGKVLRKQLKAIRKEVRNERN